MQSSQTRWVELLLRNCAFASALLPELTVRSCLQRSSGAGTSDGAFKKQ